MKEFLTAGELARFCGVDLKTIHNWADRGAVAHFRTPGRHLRFTRRNARALMRSMGMKIPDELRKEAV